MNVVDVLLAGIVTVVGTEASVVSLLARLTTRAWLSSPLVRVTVTVAVPPSSRIVVGLTDSSSSGVPVTMACTVSR